MAAGIYDIFIEQGVDREFSCQYMNPGGSTPKDLSGYSGRGHIKLDKSDCQPLAQFVVTVTNPIEGRFVVNLPANAFTGKTLRTKRSDGLVQAVYDIELYTAGDADVIRVIEGTALISLEVTK